MAILRSVDGKFYEVPDDKLDAFLIPEDKVKEKLNEAGAGQACGGGGPPSGPRRGAAGPQIVINIRGGGAPISMGSGPGAPGGAPCPSAEPEVAPYHHSSHGHGHYCGGWHNCWQNCWQNCG